MSTKRNAWSWIPTVYFAEGLPYAAVMTLSTILYKRLGVGNADIALYTSWLYLPWVIKPLWSPLVDCLFTKRSWIVAMQLAIAVGFAAVASSLTAASFFALSLAAFWVVAFASASHDIAADGFYILALDESRQSFFVGIRSTFYRVAMIVAQGAIVMLAGLLETRAGSTAVGWQWAMAAPAALFACFALYHSLILPRPPADRSGGETLRRLPAELKATVVSYFRKPGILLALAFMLLYRLPEAQLVKLISPFLLDPADAGGLGLSTTQVGTVYGTLGVSALLLGGILGGIAASRGGLRHWLMPMAWAMSLTCLAFVWLSFYTAAPLWVIYACVIIEQLGYGFGTTAYTLFLLRFSAGPRSTSHYAFSTGFMALGMMLPGMLAGAIQEAVGYQTFFLYTTLCCVVTIVVSALVKARLTPDDRFAALPNRHAN